MGKEIILSLKTYNRYEILKESLDSLNKTNFPENTKLLICDDASNDIRTINLLKNYNFNIPSELIINEKNIGCDPNGLKSMKEGLDRTDRDFVIILDDDGFYHPDWLNKILELNEKYPNTGAISCFNTEKHIILEQREDHTLKKFVSGFTILLRRKVIERLETHEWDWKITAICESLGLEIICTKDSYAQSIGEIGTHTPIGSGKKADEAKNFVGDNILALNLKKRLAERKKY